MKQLMENWKKYLITEEVEPSVEEGKICDKGISYVTRTDPGGKDIKKGKDGKLKNWSARAAQIASKYCKDPNYGKGRGKDAKDEEQELEEDCWDGYERVPGSMEGAPGSCRKKTNEGDLGDWEKENWTHSDGTPCGGGKKDGSESRCKPASKWKGMSKGEKAADNAKKKKGTKAGKQYVSATKKGKVTKSHTKESIKLEHEEIIANAIVDEMKLRREAKPAKGKRFAKKVKGKGGRTRTVSYGQAGKAKDGGDRIRPGTKKAHAYCARSNKIKKCKNPPCANTLSRKKWKCQGDRSVAE
jgi:hypothetical protein